MFRRGKKKQNNEKKSFFGAKQNIFFFTKQKSFQSLPLSPATQQKSQLRAPSNRRPKPRCVPEGDKGLRGRPRPLPSPGRRLCLGRGRGLEHHLLERRRGDAAGAAEPGDARGPLASGCLVMGQRRQQADPLPRRRRWRRRRRRRRSHRRSAVGTGLLCAGCSGLSCGLAAAAPPGAPQARAEDAEQGEEQPHEDREGQRRLVEDGRR